MYLEFNYKFLSKIKYLYQYNHYIIITLCLESQCILLIISMYHVLDSMFCRAMCGLSSGVNTFQLAAGPAARLKRPHQ